MCQNFEVKSFFKVNKRLKNYHSFFLELCYCESEKKEFWVYSLVYLFLFFCRFFHTEKTCEYVRPCIFVQIKKTSNLNIIFINSSLKWLKCTFHIKRTVNNQILYNSTKIVSPNTKKKKQLTTIKWKPINDTPNQHTLSFLSKNARHLHKNSTRRRADVKSVPK